MTRAAEPPVALEYDPSCATDGGWHYDDVLDPAAILLCPDACTAAQEDSEVQLDFEFVCEDLLRVD
jgi:hypothetical protein